MLCNSFTEHFHSKVEAIALVIIMLIQKISATCLLATVLSINLNHGSAQALSINQTGGSLACGVHDYAHSVCRSVACP
jgi:hypothetical protein